MRRRGFTLIELLVVIFIVLIIAGFGATVLYSMAKPSLSQGARLLQAALAGARDQALHDQAPSGIRLLPDPAFPIQYNADGTININQPLAANRIIPIGAAPEYTEGGVYVDPNPAYPAAIRTVNGYAGVPCLVVEEAILDNTGALNAPTNWFWNIRIGDKIQINNAGNWYTVVGPMLQPNPELFVNVGPAGTQSPWSRVLANGVMVYPEYLLLVNGRDDNGDGWIDSGFDGVDNNLRQEQLSGLPILTDDPLEWETETWVGPN